MTRSRCNRYIWAGAMLWVSAACGGSPRPPVATPGQAGAASRDAPDERGMNVKPAPSGAPSATPSNPPSAPDDSFVVEARLRARRIQDGRSITFDDLRSGDRVMGGDLLQLSVRASKDAYLYLAFCSQHAADPRYHGLSVFPEQGGVRMIADETVTIPAGTAGILLNDEPGQETLYLIASRVELSHADSGLVAVIAAARQGRETVDCGAPLRSAMAGPSRTDKPRRSGSRARRGSGDSRTPPAAGRAKPPVRAATTEADRPVVEIERGGEIAFEEGAQSGVEADLAGIVILRYELKHEPARPADRRSGAPASP